MSFLSWNCRGMGNVATVQVLMDLVHKRKPVVIFLMETLSNNNKMQALKRKLGWYGCFTVDPLGRGGGLAILWKEEVNVSVMSFSQNHIDSQIQLEGSNLAWRFTGYYGMPERSRRTESWNLIIDLASRSDLPWLLMGDFNDILHQEEKRGTHLHPESLIRGFRRAVESSGLSDFPFQGYQYTWERGRGTANWVEEKLDRILVTAAWLEKFERARAWSESVPTSDHLPLLLLPIPTARTERVKRFRFENIWVKEDKCRELVWTAWERSRGEDITVRLGSCSSLIWEWGKGLTKDFSKRLESSRKKMEALKNRTDRNSVLAFGEAQRLYLNILNQQSDYWKQRAKVMWYREGDSNTKFFHNVVKGRRKTNRIDKLEDENSVWRHKGPEMDALICDYFQKLFTSEVGDMEGVLGCLSSKVTNSQNIALIRRVSFDEVKQAVFSMHRDKSPGPDGLNPGFYQAYWDILGNDLVHLCNTVFTTGQLPGGINFTHLVLIPKKSTPTGMGDLRPIALCNVLYKIISKVIANRLKPLLDTLISENQCAFIPRRLITDNIMLAFETLHYLKRKSQGKEGFAAIKLDISKAYDRVEWPMIQALLARMGFGHHWIKLVYHCISTVSYCVLQDCKEIGPIHPKRGLRQGDPLSPYLFILLAEGLSAMLSNLESRGSIHGISIARGAPKISHLFFADDSFIFIKANQTESATMKQTLDIYGKASGQIINYHKSAVSFSTNVDRIMREQVKNILQINREGVDGNYLGLPAIIGRNKRDILGFIKDRIIH